MTDRTPGATLHVRSRLTLPQLLTSLDGLTVRTPDLWAEDARGDHPFRGTFDDAGFDLVVRSQTGRRSASTPECVGTFRPGPSGVDIAVDLRMSPTMRIIALAQGILGLSAVILMAVTLLFTWADGGAMTTMVVIAGAVVLTQAAAALARWVSVMNERKRAMEAFQRLLVAEVDGVG